MSELAIIGGTGLTALDNLTILKREIVRTDYGEPSSPLLFGEIDEKPAVFLARHGLNHHIPPHKVNYRANIKALKQSGVKHIIAVNAVGGITKEMAPGVIVVPDQIIDYTTRRVNTFFEDGLTHVTHIDFTWPYSTSLRDKLATALTRSNIPFFDYATYGATEGPRLETAAEVEKLKRDGCHIVGMTAMPEAALARELELDYASVCVVANWGAGLSDEPITMEAIQHNLESGMQQVRQALADLISDFA